MQNNKTIIDFTNRLIRNRRSVFPKTYSQEPIPNSVVDAILQNANYAPTHRLTQPWRFRVISGAAREKLGDLLADWYKANTPTDRFSEMKYKKTAKKPRISSHIIAICMQRDPKESVPEWEEIASVAMAVQNMWLTASAYDIGAYWSSPKSIQAATCRDFLQLNEGERCLGFFYMGYHNLPPTSANRTAMAEKVKWLK